MSTSAISQRLRGKGNSATSSLAATATAPADTTLDTPESVPSEPQPYDYAEPVAPPGLATFPPPTEIVLTNGQNGGGIVGLQDILSQIVSWSTNANGLGNQIATQLLQYFSPAVNGQPTLAQLLPKLPILGVIIPPRPQILEEKVISPNATAMPAYAQRNFDLANAGNTYADTQGPAASEFNSAVGAWELAQGQYNLSVTTALATFEAAVIAAVQQFDVSETPDSIRNQILYFNMAVAIATALGAYETSLAAAAATLASAAGTLLSAYVTYITTVGSAEATLLIAQATAQQTFWTTVGGSWTS